MNKFTVALPVMYVGLEDPNPTHHRFQNEGEELWFLAQPQLPIRTVALLIPPEIAPHFSVADIRVGKNSLLLTPGGIPGQVVFPLSETVVVGQTLGVHVVYRGTAPASSINDLNALTKEWQDALELLMPKEERAFYRAVTERFGVAPRQVRRPPSTTEGLAFRAFIAAHPLTY